MAAGYGDLSGPGPQQAYVWLSYVGYSQAGNYSSWYGELYYLGNGYGSWSGGSQSWSVGGFAPYVAGSFSIPQGSDTILLWKGTFTRGHDANGYLAAGSLVGSISTNHSTIGSGSASVASGTPVRIPKPPLAPGAPSLSAVKVNSLTASWSAPDARGSSLTGYEVQWATNAAFTENVKSASTNASTRTLTIGSLLPARDQWVRVRAKNGVGTGAWSTASTARTLAAFYYIDPETDIAEPLELYAWTGSAYVPVELHLDPELEGSFTPAG